MRGPARGTEGVGSGDRASGGVLAGRAVPDPVQEVDHLVRLRRRHQHPRRQLAQTEHAGVGVGQQGGDLGRVGDPDVRLRGSDPDAAVVPGDVVDQVGQWLRRGRGGVVLQPTAYVARRPARVEGPPQRRRTEPEDRRATPRLLVGQQPQLPGQPVGDRSGSDGGQIGLQHDLLHGGREGVGQVGRQRVGVGLERGPGQTGDGAQAADPEPAGFPPGPGQHRRQLHPADPGQPGAVPADHVGQVGQIEHRPHRGLGQQRGQQAADTGRARRLRLRSEGVSPRLARGPGQPVAVSPGRSQRPPAVGRFAFGPAVVVHRRQQPAPVAGRQQTRPRRRTRARRWRAGGRCRGPDPAR